jgi:hypothetical protein
MDLKTYLQLHRAKRCLLCEHLPQRCYECRKASRRKANLDPVTWERDRLTRLRRYKQNPLPHRKRAAAGAFKKAYGITLEDKERMFEAQGRVCACCGTGDPGDARGWHYDHDHKTKKGRGVVCAPCNITLGFAKESVQRLEACAEYLRKHNGL